MDRTVTGAGGAEPEREVWRGTVECHDLVGAVGPDEAQDHSELDAGQAGRLDGDCLEHGLRWRLLCAELRDAAQRGLLVGERLKLAPRLRVSQRRGDEFGELLQAMLGAARQRLCVRGSGEHSPHLALHRDGRGDGRHETELGGKFGISFSGVVVDARDAIAAPDPVRQRLCGKRDSGTDRRGPATCRFHNELVVALEARQAHRLAAEQSGCLRCDRGEHLFRRDAASHQFGDPPQGRLLLGQHRCGSLCLRVGDRHGNELREHSQSSFGTGGQRRA